MSEQAIMRIEPSQLVVDVFGVLVATFLVDLIKVVRFD